MALKNSAFALLFSAVVATAMYSPANSANDTIKIGIAMAGSGWMQAYDHEARKSALMAIDEINSKGGLLGKQIEVTEADTKSDLAEATKAGQSLIDQGAVFLLGSCDYDMGAPAALAAENAGKVSFLCGDSIMAGVQGIGPRAFTSSSVADAQGAALAQWSHSERKARTAYVLLDTTIQYTRGMCRGFDWQWKKLADTTILGKDAFKNDDASIASQITRLKALPKAPDVIMLCSYAPGGASAIRQIRAAGIDSAILSGNSLDGTFWLDAVPNLSNFFNVAKASVHGDDPRPAVNELTKRFTKKFGIAPSHQGAFDGYVAIQEWAIAVERAKTTNADGVVAELEKFRDEETVEGGRTFTHDIHIQNKLTYVIQEVANGQPKAVGLWHMSDAVPLDVMLDKN